MRIPKWVLTFVMLAVLAAQLIACTPAAPTEAPSGDTGSQPEVTQPAATEAETSGGQEIVVAIWSGPEHDNLVKTAAEYEAATGNTVIIEEVARESYYDKLGTVFVAGSDDYDVAYVSFDWTPAWVEAEALVDLSPFIAESDTANLDVLQPGVASFTFDGKVYGFPSEGDTAWLFYRKDLLEEAGIDVPQTWEEFLAAAQQLNNPPELYGATIGAKPDEAAWDFMHYFAAFGAKVLDENYNVTVNSPEGVQALTFYSDLLSKEEVVPPDVATYGYNEILTVLQQGKVAMGVEWMAATADLQNCEKSPAVCKDGEPLLDYTLIPGIEGADGTVSRGQGASQWGWVIPSGAQNQQAAYDFIEWLTSKEGAKLWALNGGIPSNTEALSDPEVVAQVPQFELLAEAMPYRNLFPNTTVSADLFTYFNDAINSAVAGAKTPQEALDDAAAKMTEALTSAGYLQ